tara:strand:+ start:3934 stop:5307 length:1374 start_codon:yes stop_codon:yes gene_type:complete
MINNSALSKYLFCFIFMLCSFVSCYTSAALPTTFYGQDLPSLAPMLKEARPAVVSVTVAGTHISKQPIPEVYRYFFGPDTPKEQVRKRPFTGLGSGVIIDAKKGYIITNYHVVAQASQIMIGLDDGRELKAKMIGSDEQADIAILQIKAHNLTAIKQSDSDRLQVGDFVIAIGNPFGLGQTVTSGIVSALGRSGLGIERLENFIQTDAAINRGNSGGALVNLRGELVGINTAIATHSGGNVGIGFAIPINMANNLSQQIIKYGQAKRGQLGIIGENLNMKLAHAFNMQNTHGVFIKQVLENSPAEHAGIEAGDIIISLNKKPIKTIETLRATIATLGAGYEVSLNIMRQGRKKAFKLTLASTQNKKVQHTKTETDSTIHPGLTGATLEESDQGIRVRRVMPRSDAEYNGFAPGDIIVGINNTRIKKLQDLNQFLRDQDTAVALSIQRDKKHLYIVLR